MDQMVISWTHVGARDKTQSCSQGLSPEPLCHDTVNMDYEISRLYNKVSRLSELRAQGFSPQRVASAQRTGHLVKISHGVYVPQQEWNEWTPRERCLAMHIAHAKTTRSGVLSHQSAALWMGAPLLHLPSKVHVSYAGESAPYSPLRVAHRGRPAVVQEAHEVWGTRITAPLQTAVDVASYLPPVEALIVLDYFAAQGTVPLDALQNVLAAQGRPKATLLARQVSCHSESPLETIARHHFYSWDLPLPEEQFLIWISAHRNYRADFTWPARKVIVEVDGNIKYSGQYGQPADAIRKEHRRQWELETAGWKIIRTQWSELMQHPITLRQRLVEAGIR